MTYFRVYRTVNTNDYGAHVARDIILASVGIAATVQYTRHWVTSLTLIKVLMA